MTDLTLEETYDQLDDTIFSRVRTSEKIKENLQALISHPDENLEQKDWYLGSAMSNLVQVEDINSGRFLWGVLSDAAKDTSNEFISDWETPPFNAAVKTGNWEMIRFLALELNCNVNKYDADGYTALYIAIKKRLGRLFDRHGRAVFVVPNEDVVRLVLEVGADVHHDVTTVNGEERSAVYHAVDKNDEDVVSVLLEHGAKPSSQGDDDGTNKSIMDLAIKNGNTEIYSLLREHGFPILLGHHGNNNNHHQKETSFETSLNVLLRDKKKAQEIKLAFCQAVVQDAKSNDDAMIFLKQSVRYEMFHGTNLAILVDAGVKPVDEIEFVGGTGGGQENGSTTSDEDEDEETGN